MASGDFIAIHPNTIDKLSTIGHSGVLSSKKVDVEKEEMESGVCDLDSQNPNDRNVISDNDNTDGAFILESPQIKSPIRTQMETSAIPSLSLTGSPRRPSSNPKRISVSLSSHDTDNAIVPDIPSKSFVKSDSSSSSVASSPSKNNGSPSPSIPLAHSETFPNKNNNNSLDELADNVSTDFTPKNSPEKSSQTSKHIISQSLSLPNTSKYQQQDEKRRFSSIEKSASTVLDEVHRRTGYSQVIDSATSVDSGIDSHHQAAALLCSDEGPSFEFASQKRNNDFKVLFPDLPPSERLIDDYSCAWKKDVLTQGRMYITERYVNFYANIFSWIYTLTVPVSDIRNVERKSIAGVIPNAICVYTENSQYYFASFLHRELAFNLISQLIDKYQRSPDLDKGVPLEYFNPDNSLVSNDSDNNNDDDDIPKNKNENILTNVNDGISKDDSLDRFDENNCNNLSYNDKTNIKKTISGDTLSKDVPPLYKKRSLTDTYLKQDKFVTDRFSRISVRRSSNFSLNDSKDISNGKSEAEFTISPISFDSGLTSNESIKYNTSDSNNKSIKSNSNASRKLIKVRIDSTNLVNANSIHLSPNNKSKYHNRIIGTSREPSPHSPSSNNRIYDDPLHEALSAELSLKEASNIDENSILENLDAGSIKVDKEENSIIIIDDLDSNNSYTDDKKFNNNSNISSSALAFSKTPKLEKNDNINVLNTSKKSKSADHKSAMSLDTSMSSLFLPKTRLYGPVSTDSEQYPSVPSTEFLDLNNDSNQLDMASTRASLSNVPTISKNEKDNKDSKKAEKSKVSKSPLIELEDVSANMTSDDFNNKKDANSTSNNNDSTSLIESTTRTSEKLKDLGIESVGQELMKDDGFKDENIKEDITMDKLCEDIPNFGYKAKALDDSFDISFKMLVSYLLGTESFCNGFLLAFLRDRRNCSNFSGSSWIQEPSDENQSLDDVLNINNNTIIKCEDIEQLKETNSKDFNKDEKSLLEIKQGNIRRFCYTVALTNPLGPKQTRLVALEKIKYYNYNSKPRLVHVYQVSSTPDVPSGSAFRTHINTIIHLETEGKCNIKVFVDVEWIKSSWIKAVATPAILDGLKNYWIELAKAIHELLDALQSAILTKKNGNENENVDLLNSNDINNGNDKITNIDKQNKFDLLQNNNIRQRYAGRGYASNPDRGLCERDPLNKPLGLDLGNGVFVPFVVTKRKRKGVVIFDKQWNKAMDTILTGLKNSPLATSIIVLSMVVFIFIICYIYAYFAIEKTLKSLKLNQTPAIAL